MGRDARRRLRPCPDRGSRSARRRRLSVGLGVILLSALLFAVGCGSGEPSSTVLVALPDLDLSRADAGARQQLAASRSHLETLLEAGVPVPGSAAGGPLAQAYGDLGSLYLTYDFLAAAEACFTNAQALAGDDYRWHYLLGYLAVSRGDLDGAIPRFEAALELRPDFLPAFLRLGRAELALGKPREAGARFASALALESEMAATHEGLARVAAASGDLTAAVEGFRRALDLEPAASGLHYALAQAYRDLGDLDRARHHLERSGDVATRIIDPLINPLASQAASLQFYLVQGAEAFDDDDFAAAASAYRSALEQDATSLPAYLGLALGLERLGDLTGAEAALDRALEAARFEVDDGEGSEDRERAALQRRLGHLAALDGRDDGAVERYAKSLKLMPDQPAVWLRLGNALARQRKFEGAIDAYDRLIDTTPQWSAAVLEKRAMARVNLGQRQGAIADFEAALAEAPNDLRLRQRFAEALEYLGESVSAERQKTVARQLATGDGERFALLLAEAQSHFQQQDFDGTVERFRQALAIDASALEVRLDLANVLGHLRRYDEALAEYGILLQAAPRLEAAHRGQVVALILGGRLGEARLALQEALRTFPRHRGLALTQVRLLAMSPDPQVRDGALALQIARRVDEDRRTLSSRQALALAAAAAGDHGVAVALQQQVVDEMAAAGEGDAAAQRLQGERDRLAAFIDGRAWTAATADEILAALDAD